MESINVPSQDSLGSKPLFPGRWKRKKGDRERFDLTMETTSDEYDHPVKPISKRMVKRKQSAERLSEDADLADDLFRAKYNKFSIKATHKYKPVNWPSDDDGLTYEYNCWHLGNEVQKFIPIFLLTSWVTAIIGYELIIIGYRTILPFRCQVKFDEESIYNTEKKIGQASIPWFIPTTQSCWAYASALNPSTQSVNLTLINCYNTEHFKWPKEGDLEYKLTIFVEVKLRCSTYDSGGFIMYCLYVVGAIIGAASAGIQCDRIGRKRIFNYMALAHIFGALLMVVAPGYIVYLLGRWLLGASAPGLIISAFCLLFEFSSYHTRIFAVCFFRVFQLVGILIFNVLASNPKLANWIIRDIVLFILTLPLLLGVCTLPESLRWLRTQNLDNEITAVTEYVSQKFFTYKCRFYIQAPCDYQFAHSDLYHFIGAHIISVLVFTLSFMVLSPNNLWRLESLGLRNHNIYVFDYLFFLPVAVFGTCFLAYVFLINLPRVVAYYSLLVLSLILYAVSCGFNALNDVSLDIVLPATVMMNSAFIVLVLIIAEQTPTSVLGGMLGFLCAWQLIFYVIFDNCVYRILDNVAWAWTPQITAIGMIVGVGIVGCVLRATSGIICIYSWADSAAFAATYPKQYMY